MDDEKLTEFMADATERLAKRVASNTLSQPGTAAFVAKFTVRSRKASKKRKEYQAKGIHIPGFLICSITTQCNLRCKGCYAANNGILGKEVRPSMTEAEWKSVFEQAHDLGISFIILAGGEPLMRMPVLEIAKDYDEIVFPVFTNGTMLPEKIEFFRSNRNLIPVISIDGPRQYTDERRDAGVYDKVIESLALLDKNKLFHGASVTVTSDNVELVTSDSFVSTLRENGVGIVFFIEYVPTPETMHLALGDKGRKILAGKITEMRETFRDTVFMSFPGDEAAFGGCIGAGRGFMHINPYGDAEACPASPHTDTNLKEKTLLQAIGSPLFVKIRESELISLPHEGGCALAEHEPEIIRIEGADK
ncbi:MAG: radical SAM protein [archaeon]|nr:radical SAM protein [archaeon]